MRKSAYNKSILTIVAFLALLLNAAWAQAQETSRNPEADSLIMKRFAIARNLIKYDAAGMAGTQAMLHDLREEDQRRITSPWFCYSDKQNNWHVVFGAYDDSLDSYLTLVHYTVNDSLRIINTDCYPDMSVVLPYARALDKLVPIIDSIRVSSHVLFNWYITTEDNNIMVRLLPVVQKNMVLAYGFEFEFRLPGTDGKSDPVLDFSMTSPRAFKADTANTATLDYRALNVPTVGAFMYALAFRNYFKQLEIHCAESAFSIDFDKEKHRFKLTTRFRQENKPTPEPENDNGPQDAAGTEGKKK